MGEELEIKVYRKKALLKSVSVVISLYISIV